MRSAFFNTLATITERERNVILLTGDLGYMVVEHFKERFPDRFINVGVAEENMVGMATGLAASGFLPFVYSIVNFVLYRPYEFVRNGPVLHRLPVRLVGVGGGLEYGANGATHWGLEDLAITRCQPGLRVVAPADGRHASALLAETWNLPGPVYYRLGKGDKAVVPGDVVDESGLERVIELVRCGDDATLIAIGPVASEAVEAAHLLEKKGVGCKVLLVSSLNPAPAADVAAALAMAPLVFTIEEHYIVGGLGSAVMEIAAESRSRPRIIRLGVGSLPDGRTGSQRHLRDAWGLSAAKIAQAVLEARAG